MNKTNEDCDRCGENCGWNTSEATVCTGPYTEEEYIFSLQSKAEDDLSRSEALELMHYYKDLLANLTKEHDALRKSAYDADVRHKELDNKHRTLRQRINAAEVSISATLALLSNS